MVDSNFLGLNREQDRMERDEKVAIVDNSINPKIYTPVAHWTSFIEAPWLAFTARDFQFPNLDEEFTHLILTGSEASVLERDEWVHKEVDLVLEAVERNVPVLGSCWGHQLLALALAGPEHLQRSECPEIGWIPLDITEEETLLGKKGKAYVFSSHFDEVIDLDENFDVIASSENCSIHAFKWGKKPVWGIQSHPEMNIEEAKRYLRKNVRFNREFCAFYRRALDSKPKDTGMIHTIIRNFLAVSNSNSQSKF